MNIFTLISLSFGMAMDAFAVAIAKGASNKHPSFIQALKGGIFFGVVEAIAPLIGYFLGSVAIEWVADFDHWIAFGLLVLLGVRFIRESFVSEKADDVPAQHQNFGLLLMTAIATSIDSMVVGMSLAFLEINIYLAALLIGVATTIMATLGLYLGNRMGVKFGKIAMMLGGLVLIIIGASILYSHLTA